jgi:cytochrome c oxidase subunit 2
MAKQWMWKFSYPQGPNGLDVLRVPAGRPVRLLLTSRDVIHSFFVPAFRLKQDVLPGRTTQTSFQATKQGIFHLFCAEFCGTDHARMLGRIVVISPEDYARWLTAQPQGDDLAHRGASLFIARGCAGCHAPASKVHAPKLVGLYGRPVQLSDGRTVTADEAYIRDSILEPRRDVVAGYEPVMPSFAGLLSEGEIQALVAHIRSLSTAQDETLGRPGTAADTLVPGTAAERSPAMLPGAGSPVDERGGVR